MKIYLHQRILFILGSFDLATVNKCRERHYRNFLTTYLLHMDGLNCYLLFVTLAFGISSKIVWPWLGWNNCDNVCWMSLFVFILKSIWLVCLSGKITLVVLTGRDSTGTLPLCISFLLYLETVRIFLKNGGH